MQIISCSLYLSKIDKSQIIKTDKNGNPFKGGGEYFNFTVIVNDTPDKYGKDASLSLNQTQEDRKAKKPKTFIGNGKTVFKSASNEAKQDNGFTDRGGVVTSNDSDLPF